MFEKDKFSDSGRYRIRTKWSWFRTYYFNFNTEKWVLKKDYLDQILECTFDEMHGMTVRDKHKQLLNGNSRNYDIRYRL